MDSSVANAINDQTIATLASAIVVASGRAWSIEEVLDLMRDIEFARRPQPNSGAYQHWEKDREAKVKKIRK